MPIHTYIETATERTHALNATRHDDAQEHFCTDNRRTLKRPAENRMPPLSQSQQSCKAQCALMRHMVNLHSEWILDYGTLKHEDLDSLFGTNQLTDALLEHYIAMARHEMEARLRARANAT